MPAADPLPVFVVVFKMPPKNGLTLTTGSWKGAYFEAGVKGAESVLRA